MESFFSTPLSFRERNPVSSYSISPVLTVQDPNYVQIMKGHSSHPDFMHLTLLVFEAVLEVVFVALPGYIVARMGMFDVEAQKLVANLNIYIFTPCLIFSKLGSQLNANKLYELAVIPGIFIIQTFVSWLCAFLVSKAFGFSKRPSNFVTAMAVFGNSNSLPISLILSLSQTIAGLHWDRIKGDNDNEVGARGILYLLIFQQLGQLVRWTWGYNVLLKSKEEFEEDEAPASPPDTDEPLILDVEAANRDDDEESRMRSPESHSYLGDQTPITYHPTTASFSGSNSSSTSSLQDAAARATRIHKRVPNHIDDSEETLLTTFPTPGQDKSRNPIQWLKFQAAKVKFIVRRNCIRTGRSVSKGCKAVFQALPNPIQATLGWIYKVIAGFFGKVWSFMNPPLWAMLVAVLVASIPQLQYLFFKNGTFVNNSITHAVNQTGQVAVPLILVVLGANLGRSTSPQMEAEEDEEDSKIETKLLCASLIARMLLPVVIMGPILALFAKYVPVSILDDPIFVIVCFLLVGAPSALQLAQICQTKNVYMGAMSKVLFQSYVVWIFPSTMVLVLCALEVVEWAK